MVCCRDYRERSGPFGLTIGCASYPLGTHFMFYGGDLAVYVWRHVYDRYKKEMAENNIYHVITSHSGTLPPMMNLGFQPSHRVKEIF